MVARSSGCSLCVKRRVKVPHPLSHDHGMMLTRHSVTRDSLDAQDVKRMASLVQDMIGISNSSQASLIGHDVDALTQRGGLPRETTQTIIISL